jgi:hypothetical protein
MRKSLFLLVCGLLLAVASGAQTDKAQLSQNIMKKYQENTKLLQQMTWQRQMQGFVQGSPVMSSVASVTLTSDYKYQAVVTQQQGYVAKKRGLRGAVQASVVSDVNEYTKQAIQLSERYIVLTPGQMLDLFTRGTVAETADGKIQAQATALLNPGDNVNYKFDKSNLLYTSQEFTFLIGQDPVKGQVQYENFNGVNRVTNITLNVTKVGVTVKLTNFNYAKKM